MRPAKTPHTAYRVADPDVSLDSYSALGHLDVGRISVGHGATSTMLKFPGEGVVSLSWFTDPDGYRIELVQWPAGHADGISAADFGRS